MSLGTQADRAEGIQNGYNSWPRRTQWSMFNEYKEGMTRAGITKPMILQDAKAQRREIDIQEKNGEVRSTTSTGTVYHL